MLHDCALAGDDVVVFDFPLTVRPARMLSDKFPVEYEPTHGARIGVVHRETGATTWAAVEPGVVLHAANAHFEGDELVVRALRSLPATPSSFIAARRPRLPPSAPRDRRVTVSRAGLHARVPLRMENTG